MTLEKLRAILPKKIGEEDAARILAALNGEIAPYREKAEQYDELIAQTQREKQQAQEQALQQEIERVLREKGARSLRAAKALLDMEAIRGREDWKKAIAEEVEKLEKSAEGAFLFLPEKTGRKVSVGAALKKAGGGDETAAIRRAAGL